MKRKNVFFLWLFLRFFVTLASPKLLALRKVQINLAFPSFIRNFAVCDGEITPSRQKKERVLLFCSRLLVTLHTTYYY